MIGLDVIDPAAAISGRLGYPFDQEQADFVRVLVRAWARECRNDADFWGLSFKEIVDQRLAELREDRIHRLLDAAAGEFLRAPEALENHSSHKTTQVADFAEGENDSLDAGAFVGGQR